MGRLKSGIHHSWNRRNFLCGCFFHLQKLELTKWLILIQWIPKFLFNSLKIRFWNFHPRKRPRKSQKVDFRCWVPRKLVRVWHHYKLFLDSSKRYADSSFIHWGQNPKNPEITIPNLLMGAGTVSCKVINFNKPEITKWPEVE